MTAYPGQYDSMGEQDQPGEASGALFQEKQIECIGCGETFAWTVGEQKFMQGLIDKGEISNPSDPKRCKPCRDKRKAMRQ